MTVIGKAKEGAERMSAREASIGELYITPLIQRSLEHVSESRHLEKDLLKLAIDLAARANSLDACVIEDIAKFALSHLMDGQGVSSSNAIILLFHCAAFYERTGKAQEGLALMKTALSYATDLDIVDLQRRSHNMLGIFYSRLCDFANSCSHLEIAYRLASQMRSSFLTFSALANAVASLQTMGLLQNARDLALSISKRFENDKQLDTLQIPNASNGIIISHLIGDQVSAAIFYDISIRSAASSISSVDELTRAYFEAARATHLTATGNATSALMYINRALTWGVTQNNIRINAVLFGAQAEVHLALGDITNIEGSEERLMDLLKDTINLPWHHEDLLRTLYKLYSDRSGRRVPSKRAKALKILKRLREHMIAVKHGRFYSSKSIKTSDKLGNPAYTVPEWILKAGGSDDRVGEDRIVTQDCATPARGIDDQLVKVSNTVARLASSKAEIRLQTSYYHAVENWAVAADFASGGDGRDGLRVGKLAAMIASEIGFSKENCIATELACRLRNVGSVFVDSLGCDFDRFREFGRFSPLCDHAVFGEILLSSSSDAILQLAARVAKSHHEWWNGCGYPLGLAGAAIPLEGRICMLADIFISYVTPHQRRKPWPIDVAFHQIESMAGFQVDPSLLAPLRRVLEGWLGEDYGSSDRLSSNFALRGGFGAKRRFLERLELSRS